MYSVDDHQKVPTVQYTVHDHQRMNCLAAVEVDSMTSKIRTGDTVLTTIRPQIPINKQLTENQTVLIKFVSWRSDQNPIQ